MAHVSAEAVGVRVGGVLAPQAALGVACARQALALALLHVVAQALAADVEQRTDDGAVGVLHGAEAARPGAHHGAHVEVLHAVVGGVSGEDAALGQGRGGVAAQACERLVGGEVALAAGDGLHVAALALRLAGDVDLAAEQGDPKQLRQLRRERLILIGGTGAQPMVHMQHGDGPDGPFIGQLPRDVRQRRGVRAARHHEQHGRLGVRQPAPLDAAPRRREHVLGTRGRIGAEPGIACRGALVPRSLLLCHFLPYLYIWLPLHALDERDGFDVVGVREHVHGLHRSHAVAELLEKAQVTDLRFRVA